jgi:hypothetical protein
MAQTNSKRKYLKPMIYLDNPRFINKKHQKKISNRRLRHATTNDLNIVSGRLHYYY